MTSFRVWKEGGEGRIKIKVLWLRLEGGKQLLWSKGKGGLQGNSEKDSKLGRFRRRLRYLLFRSEKRGEWLELSSSIILDREYGGKRRADRRRYGFFIRVKKEACGFCSY